MLSSGPLTHSEQIRHVDSNLLTQLSHLLKCLVPFSLFQAKGRAQPQLRSVWSHMYHSEFVPPVFPSSVDLTQAPSPAQPVSGCTWVQQAIAAAQLWTPPGLFVIRHRPTSSPSEVIRARAGYWLNYTWKQRHLKETRGLNIMINYGIIWEDKSQLNKNNKGLHAVGEGWVFNSKLQFPSEWNMNIKGKVLL